MSKYRCEYIYRTHFGRPQHIWTCIGATHALHLHITDMGEDCGQSERYSGGIETHYRYPPEYMANNAPTEDECWLMKCPCWRDGSSLQASRDWIPFWLSAPNDHDGMFRKLEMEMERRTPTTLAMLQQQIGDDA